MASIKQLAINAIKTKLISITKANGYTRNITANSIFTHADTATDIPMPAIILLEGEEEILKQYSDRYECRLELIVGFVDSWGSDDLEAGANIFMAEIQKAMGVEFNVTTTLYTTGTSVNTTVQLFEKGSEIYVANSLPNQITGKITYHVTYRRHILDPNKH